MFNLYRFYFKTNSKQVYALHTEPKCKYTSLPRELFLVQHYLPLDHITSSTSWIELRIRTVQIEHIHQLLVSGVKSKMALQLGKTRKDSFKKDT